MIVATLYGIMESQIFGDLTSGEMANSLHVSVPASIQILLDGTPGSSIDTYPSIQYLQTKLPDYLYGRRLHSRFRLGNIVE